jgi:hypothetical protein
MLRSLRACATTVEITVEQQAKLPQEAARRGEKGFWSIIHHRQPAGGSHAMDAKGLTPILNVSDLAESFAWFETSTMTATRATGSWRGESSRSGASGADLLCRRAGSPSRGWRVLPGGGCAGGGGRRGEDVPAA